MYPGLSIKRTTLSDYCVKLREEIFKYAQPPAAGNPVLSGGSILAPHTDEVRRLLADGKPVTAIFAAINTAGYTGSYSLLQQYCLKLKPIMRRIKKTTRKVRRRELVTTTWSGRAALTETDIAYIEEKHPVFAEIKAIVAEFRDVYSNEDVNAVKLWCERYVQCKFPAICSFINGINADADAFYNSMKYPYSNGLLEGCVNKLKAIKRSMYGRASYALLRAKMLLNNTG
jgi:hypothetical protein